MAPKLPSDNSVISDKISEKEIVVNTPLPLGIVSPVREKPITVVPPAVTSNEHHLQSSDAPFNDKPVTSN